MDTTHFQQTIICERLVLVNSTKEILEHILSDDTGIEKYLGIHVPEKWTEFGSAPFQYSLDQIKDHPMDSIWWSWLPILASENMLIGNCGYKGPPADGMVEIGYEVSEKYRGQGYAYEMAAALIKNAQRDERVNCIVAHTLAEENASVSVLRKCGFQFIAETNDPVDGMIWRWEKNEW